MDARIGDGNSSEKLQRLVDVARNADDLSAMSEELARSVDSLESALAFSRQRHCLLRPLRIRAGERVLEAGGKFGAFARYLGELGAEVLSIDRNGESAEVAQIRCRDLPNVAISTSELLQMPLPEDFDWVILSGDVPLPGAIFATRSQLRQILAIADQALSSTGTLVFSAENRLGLKYLLGAKSARAHQPFEVLNSMGRSESSPFDLDHVLCEIRRAGFCNIEVLLPFPDHLFPKAILRASAMGPGGISLANALWGISGRDYADDWYALVDEHRLWDSLQRNSIAEPLANSILIVAQRSECEGMPIEDADAWRFTVGNRYSRLAKSVVITPPNESGERTVAASHLLPTDEPPFLKLRSGLSGRQVVEGGPFYSGPTEAVRIADSFGGADRQVATEYLRWARFLFQQSRLEGDKDASRIGDWSLSGDLAELIPQNIIWPDDRQQPHVFDNEPQFDGEVPLVWVLYRGILQCMRYHDPETILRLVADDIGLTVCSEDIELAQRLEVEMVEAFEFPSKWVLPNPIDFPMIQVNRRRLEQEAESLRVHNQAVAARKSIRAALLLAQIAERPLRWWRSIRS